MNTKKTITISIILIICFLFPAAVLAKGIKERMKERLPVIVDLKAKGIIGENFQGYLEFVSDVQQNKDVVDDENKDRKEIYSYIANKQGANIELVGQRRAKQLAKNAKPGEFLQNEDGTWYKK
jgi:uncharacterized protein YdbL (DUF1318 family)